MVLVTSFTMSWELCVFKGGLLTQGGCVVIAGCVVNGGYVFCAPPLGYEPPATVGYYPAAP